jgi:hypothetical protein
MIPTFPIPSYLALHPFCPLDLVGLQVAIAAFRGSTWDQIERIR